MEPEKSKKRETAGGRKEKKKKRRGRNGRAQNGEQKVNCSRKIGRIELQAAQESHSGRPRTGRFPIFSIAR